jgi:hypothetical protein
MRKSIKCYSYLLRDEMYDNGEFTKRQEQQFRYEMNKSVRHLSLCGRRIRLQSKALILKAIKKSHI